MGKKKKKKKCGTKFGGGKVVLLGRVAQCECQYARKRIKEDTKGSRGGISLPGEH